MAKLIRQGVYFMEGHLVKDALAFMTSDKREKAIKNTVTHAILSARTTVSGETLEIKADAASASGRDAVELMQTFFASGGERLALPLTLFGVKGAEYGSLRSDENSFLLSSVKRVGADFVHSYLSGESEYLADVVAKSGQIVLGYRNAGLGAVGAMAVNTGEALSRVLAGKPFVVPLPQTVAVYVRGKLRKGVGAADAALDLLQAIGNSSFAEGKILEFFGTGVSNLSMEARAEIDRLAAKSGCFSTVWETDERTEEYFADRGRAKAYKHLSPKQPAYYDWGITLDLSRVEPMIALPESRTIVTVAEYLAQENAVKKAERAYLAGGYETVCECAEILRTAEGAPAFALTVSPATQQAYKNLADGGVLSLLLASGVRVSADFDAVSSQNGLALAHASADLWESGVALADARSIAATAKNGGKITSALDLEYNRRCKKFKFDQALYAGVFHGKRANAEQELAFSHSVSELPELPALSKHLLAKVLYCTKEQLAQADLYTPETFLRHRSAPDRMQAFTLAERDARAKERSAAVLGEACGKLSESASKEIGGFVLPKNGAYEGAIVAGAIELDGATASRTALALRLFSCRVLVCKKELSACARTAFVNAGILPLTAEKIEWKAGDAFYFEGLADALKRGEERVVVKVLSRGKARDAAFSFGELSAEERKILLAGGRLNYDQISE